MKMHFSNAVSCTGMLKLEMGKVVIMEALEWGAAEPDEKPAEPKPETPAPKPAPQKPDAEAGKDGAAPLDESATGPKNPLYDAKVGEWVRMRNVVQGEETVSTLRVIEVGDDEIKLESRVAYGGTEIKGAVLNRPRRATLNLGGRGGRAKVELGKDTLEVNGRKIECITITRTTRRGQVDKRWISHEVPVNGLVRHERGAKVVKQLLDWGTGEPPALPASK